MNIYLDLDQVLVQTAHLSKVQAVAEADAAIASIQNWITKRGRELRPGSLQEKKDARDLLVQEGVEIEAGGFLMTTTPRPGLTKFLQQLTQLGDVFLLSAGTMRYIDAIVDALSIRQLFKSLLSTQNPELIAPPNDSSWVLVDDLGFETMGVQEKLRLLGDVKPRRLIQAARFEGIPDKYLEDILLGRIRNVIQT